MTQLSSDVEREGLILISACVSFPAPFHRMVASQLFFIGLPFSSKNRMKSAVLSEISTSPTSMFATSAIARTAFMEGATRLGERLPLRTANLNGPGHLRTN